MISLWICLLVTTNILVGTFAGTNANCQQSTVIVHLFNWKWTDIAAECERFLGPRGYCGVQVSPPNEHIIAGNREWWERYQVVSYQLKSRSGDDAEFRDMVNRCNAVGVNIYVDAVINHMTGGGSGYGSGGCWYNAATGDYPCVPYNGSDFNGCGGVCNSDPNCVIDNYGDAIEIRNCRLVGLLDLALGKEYVRGKVRDYLNYLIDIGVAGFRVDAAKHMWPGDLYPIYDGLNGDPYIFMEVIDHGSEPVQATEYTLLGSVTEFKFSENIGNKFRYGKLAHLSNFGKPWGFLSDADPLVFVDNHDNQRDGGPGIISYKDSKLYKLANAFMLAWPYGFTRVMSSFDFSNRDQGPPSNPDGSIKDVPINPDETCGDGWICEHRWRQIFNMVEFRNVVDGTGVKHWWDNGNNQIAWARGNKGFIAINNDNTDMHLNNYYIGFPDGTYCDVISGSLQNGACTNRQVTVVSGMISLSVYTTWEDPMFAFHECSKIGSTCSTSHNYQRTVVFLRKQTNFGESVFLMGGKVHGCSGGNCPVRIQYNSLGTSAHYDAYNAWRQGNDQLDWAGAQYTQATYNGQTAEGSAMAWTSNVPSSSGYQLLNQYGEHYWMIDVHMNCDDTDNGWFDLKGYMDGWEPDVSQSSCTGSSGGSAPNPTNNHVAMCGKINVFQWGTGSCIINNF